MIALEAVGIFAPLSRAADDMTAPENGRVIQLPPFLVEDNTMALRWRYAAVGNMEVLTLCGDDASADFVQRVHRINELFHVLVPARFCFQSDIPETYLLVNEEVGRLRSREIIDQLVRKEGAVVDPDGTVQLRTPVASADPFGRMSQRRVAFFPNIHFWDADGSALLTILHPESSEHFTLSADAVMYALERRCPALPPWFVSGMIELFQHVTIGDDDIVIDPAVWISEADTARARDGDNPRTLLPIREILFPEEPADTNGGREFKRVWQAESELLVRWALFDHEGAHRQALWRFLDRLEREPVSESMFRQEFGVGFSDVFERLADYVPTAATQHVTLKGPKTTPLPRFKFRDATPVEVARIRGDWERMEIKTVRQQMPSLVSTYVEQARRTLHRAYDHGARDPQLLAVVGLTEFDAGNAAGALPYLEAAMRGHVVRPRVYFEVARARYHAIIGDERAARKLTAEQVQSIVTPAIVACRQAPPLPENYTLIADVWAHATTPPPADQLDVLDAGVRLFPGLASYVARVVELNVAAGRVADALAVADAGARGARSLRAREHFETLCADLQRLSEPSTPPSATPRIESDPR